MFRSIMLPLDGSAFGEHALALARSVAERTPDRDTRLHLVHVHAPYTFIYMDGMPVLDEPDREHTLSHEHAYLQVQADRLQAETKLPVTVNVVEDDILPGLLRYVQQHAIDLVVMTTHGRGPLERAWLGSTADGMLRQSHTPLLLLRPPEHAPQLDTAWNVQHIVVPLDGSALAEQVLAPATTLGQLFDARYTLLNVIATVPLGSYTLGVETVAFNTQTDQRYRTDALSYLERTAQRLRAAGLVVATHVTSAHQPASGILEAAREAEAQLIALATHGRGGMQRLMLGSVADKVVRATHMPVLVYRPPAS